MPGFENTVIINRPKDDIFAFMTNLENAKPRGFFVKVLMEARA